MARGGVEGIQSFTRLEIKEGGWLGWWEKCRMKMVLSPVMLASNDLQPPCWRSPAPLVLFDSEL
jgi:hypothetical protein